MERPSWAVVGTAMTRHLDWLEQNAGRGTAREVVDGTLGRLQRQLARLDCPEPASQVMPAAVTLQECGTLLGNPALTRRAARLLDHARKTPQGVAPLVAGLVDEVRRTSSWLRIWRALNTPSQARNPLQYGRPQSAELERN
jgi:hypothetical protein